MENDEINREIAVLQFNAFLRAFRVFAIIFAMVSTYAIILVNSTVIEGEADWDWCFTSEGWYHSVILSAMWLTTFNLIFAAKIISEDFKKAYANAMSLARIANLCNLLFFLYISSLIISYKYTIDSVWYPIGIIVFSLIGNYFARYDSVTLDKWFKGVYGKCLFPYQTDTAMSSLSFMNIILLYAALILTIYYELWPMFQ